MASPDPRAFLEWEAHQPEPYEFFGGKVGLKVGGTLGHNTVADNLHVALAIRLNGTNYRAWRANTRVRSPGGEITYPDVVVSCKHRRSDSLYLDDPILIVEVLSPATADLELTRKRWTYVAIPTLQQLVYVAPDTAKLELVTREPDNSWRSVFVTGLDADLPLACLDLTLPMAEIYADTAVATG
jgi:Uma2 family endonuclease